MRALRRFRVCGSAGGSWRTWLLRECWFGYVACAPPESRSRQAARHAGLRLGRTRGRQGPQRRTGRTVPTNRQGLGRMPHAACRLREGRPQPSSTLEQPPGNRPAHAYLHPPSFRLIFLLENTHCQDHPKIDRNPLLELGKFGICSGSLHSGNRPFLQAHFSLDKT